jgi:GT2 family glycosyltransferase
VSPSTTDRPLVSAIVVNWNGARDLERGLPSLVAQSYRPLEIVVMDNASSDDSAEVVRRFPAVRWVPLDRNLGLAPAMNRGSKLAMGQLLLFLNNDMRVDQDFVGRLVGELVRAPDIFCVDGMQYDWEGREVIHAATFVAVKDGGERTLKVFSGFYINQQRLSVATDVFTASAANMMVKRDMFATLGGFDERILFGYEDVDICWRARVRGWRTVFVPSAIAWHDVSKSNRTLAGARYRFRGTLAGRLFFCTKLLPARFAFRFWGLSVLGAGKDLARRDLWQLRDRVATLARVATYVPALVRERRQIYRRGAVTPVEQLRRAMRIGPTSPAGEP